MSCALVVLAVLLLLNTSRSHRGPPMCAGVHTCCCPLVLPLVLPPERRRWCLLPAIPSCLLWLYVILCICPFNDVPCSLIHPLVSPAPPASPRAGTSRLVPPLPCWPSAFPHALTAAWQPGPTARRQRTSASSERLGRFTPPELVAAVLLMLPMQP